jgi:hypothetical protein
MAEGVLWNRTLVRLLSRKRIAGHDRSSFVRNFGTKKPRRGDIGRHASTERIIHKRNTDEDGRQLHGRKAAGGVGRLEGDFNTIVSTELKQGVSRIHPLLAKRGSAKSARTQQVCLNIINHVLFWSDG